MLYGVLQSRGWLRLFLSCPPQSVPFTLDERFSLNWNTGLLDVYESSAQNIVTRLNIYRRNRVGAAEACIQVFVLDPPIISVARHSASLTTSAPNIEPESIIPPLESDIKNSVVLLLQLVIGMNGMMWDRNIRLQQALREVCEIAGTPPTFRGRQRPPTMSRQTPTLKFSYHPGQPALGANVSRVHDSIKNPTREGTPEHDTAATVLPLNMDGHLDKKLKDARLSGIMNPLLAGIKFTVLRKAAEVAEARGSILSVWLPITIEKSVLVLMNTATGHLLVLPPTNSTLSGMLQPLATVIKQYLDSSSPPTFFKDDTILEDYPSNPSDHENESGN